MNTITLIVAAFAFFAFNGLAQASALNYSFQGTVSLSSPDLGATIGDPFTASFTLESVPQAGATFNIANYTATNVQFAFGTYVGGALGGNGFQSNDIGQDSFGLSSAISDGLAGPNIGAFGLTIFGLTFFNFNDQGIGDASVLQSPLNPSDFVGHTAFAGFFAGGTQEALNANIASVVVTPLASVPEPSTWATMILGFFGIGFMTYRKRKNGLALAV